MRTFQNSLRTQFQRSLYSPARRYTTRIGQRSRLRRLSFPGLWVQPARRGASRALVSSWLFVGFLRRCPSASPFTSNCAALSCARCVGDTGGDRQRGGAADAADGGGQAGWGSLALGWPAGWLISIQQLSVPRRRSVGVRPSSVGPPSLQFAYPRNGRCIRAANGDASGVRSSWAPVLLLLLLLPLIDLHHPIKPPWTNELK